MNSQLRRQQTICRVARVGGFGYWSGRDVAVEFRPAAENSGLVFVRRDLSPAVSIAVTSANRIETLRRTTLTAGGAKVEMVEHIIAALAGLQIDNCEIWVDAAEMPGCDGSSLPFVDALCRAGVSPQASSRRRCVVSRPIRVQEGSTWVEALPPAPGREDLELSCEIDYGADSQIGRQHLKLRATPETFRRQLAAARTFLLQSEADQLRSQGLGLRVGYSDLLVFGPEGLRQNRLRFKDECVRHKMLDLLGDLALAGCDIVGRVRAHCSGHRLNGRLAAELRQVIDEPAFFQKTA